METPAWLLADEDYSPRSDRDAFIDRSILTFLALVSKARRRVARDGGRRPIEAFFKLIALLLLLLLVSLTRSTAFLAIVGTALLAALAAQRGERIASVLKTSLAVAAFTALILLPAALGGRAAAALLIVAKVFVSVASVKLAFAGSEWSSVSGALRRLRVPDLFILVFDIALKYIALLGDFALSMLYALRLRSVGRNAGKRASLSGIGGTLFLKSKEMAEEMYAAMECRGFSGEYTSSGRPRFAAREAALIAGMAALASAFFLLPGA
jgi:cobalt/nickel transport system permease protein